MTPSLLLISTYSHLHQTMACIESINSQHGQNNVKIYVGLVAKNFFDESVLLDYLPSNTEVISTKALSLPEQFFFKYDPFQVCCATKAYFSEYIIKEYKPEVLVYLDSDTYVYAPFFDILKSFIDDGSSSVLLTPHLCSIASPMEVLKFERSGNINAGFFCVKNTVDGLSFLNLWKDFVFSHCYLSVDEGIFFEQKWLNYALLSSYVKVELDTGANVAYWNLHEKDRSLNVVDNVVFSGKSKLIFFHYSGFSWPKLTTYNEVSSIPKVLIELMNNYNDRLGYWADKLRFILLTENGFDKYNDGTLILKVDRDIFLRIENERKVNIKGIDVFNRYELNVIKKNYIKRHGCYLPTYESKADIFDRLKSQFFLGWLIKVWLKLKGVVVC